jgi:hypothetical protein
VLVECKLLRNPEARREVIAQLFEYASLLSEWTYSELEARLKKARGLTGENPIFAALKAVHPELDEGAFVHSVNRSLERGDFPCAIAGDGIRRATRMAAAHLQRSGEHTSAPPRRYG